MPGQGQSKAIKKEEVSKYKDVTRTLKKAKRKMIRKDGKKELYLID